MPVLDPRVHSSVEQRDVVEPRIVEREDDPRRRGHPVLAVVDDDARVVGDAERCEAAAQRVCGRHLERQPVRRRDADVVHLDVPSPGNVSGREGRLRPDVQQHEVRVVQMLREPGGRDQEPVARADCRRAGECANQRKGGKDRRKPCHGNDLRSPAANGLLQDNLQRVVVVCLGDRAAVSVSGTGRAGAGRCCRSRRPLSSPRRAADDDERTRRCRRRASRRWARPVPARRCRRRSRCRRWRASRGASA